MRSIRAAAVLLVVLAAIVVAVLCISGTAYAADPIVETRQESGVACGNATLNGLILSCGDLGCTEWGFDWGLTEYYGSSWTYNGTCPASGATPTPSPTPTPTPQATATCTVEPCAIGYYDHEISGLANDSIYHYRAKVKCNGVWYYGDDRLFFTGTKFETSEVQNGILYRYIHGSQWGSMAFTTGNVTTYPYYIQNVYLRLNRSGDPGPIIVSIREADSAGKPQGSDLTSGTINGDAITTDDFGEWYCVPLTAYGLQYNTTYAIVVRATTAGYPASYVMWMRSTGYGSGNHSMSSDSGQTWTAYPTMDMMFQTWGVASLDVFDVKIFSSVVQNADWYIAINYINEVPPEYPAEDPIQMYTMALLNGNNASDILAGTPMRCWGFKPCALYISQANTAGLSWGGSYTLRIYRDLEPYYEPYADYTLDNADWVGSEMWWLGEWVIEVAERLEAYYGQTLTMTSYDDVDFEVTVLNTLGAQIFTECMLGIGELVPDRFWAVPAGDVPWGDEGTHEMADQSEWRETWGGNGSQLIDLIDSAGDVAGTSPKTAAGILCFLFFAAAVGVMLVGKGSKLSIEAALALGVPILIVGAWGMVFPVAVLAIFGLIEMFGVVWVIFLRGT